MITGGFPGDRLGCYSVATAAHGYLLFARRTSMLLISL
jgi:hypothetical protein